MASIARLTLGTPAAALPVWDAIVVEVQKWASGRGVSLQDAVLLVPFAQHLPLARKAWARTGGWLPRVETSQTLSAALRPARPPGAGQISSDTANDRLTAARLLTAHAWAAQWERRDPRGFAQAVAQFVETGHALLRAARELAPGERAVHWERSRALLASAAAHGGIERSLARVALEWAAGADAPATDALFALRPSAWIAVQAGGTDRLVQRLLEAALPTAPCAVLDTDAAIEAPFDALATCAHTRDIGVAACAAFEAEAQAAAAQVLAHVSRGEVPVALIAQDRQLVRRVRALLERQPVQLLDETGWKLSTTRAAAQVIGLLRGADAHAGNDLLLDWLKGTPLGTGAALAGLETQMRRKAWSGRDHVDPALLDPAAAALWRSATALLQALARPARKTLAQWLDALATALKACGSWATLEVDDAGQQVLAALGLTRVAQPGSAWDANRHGPAMTLDAFAAWADATLEQSSYLPQPPDATEAVQVVITPLARAMLRPFGGVVFPGTDEKRLGMPPPAPALLGEPLAVALGLQDSDARRAVQTLAFEHVLRAPRVTLLRRTFEGTDPLAASPLLDRLALAADRAGAPLGAWTDPRTQRAVSAHPVSRPAPSARQRLPARLSASACEALRACPYRFFALHVLGLRETDELERAVEKRDYGTWLHGVLYAFHRDRVARSVEADRTALLAAGRAQQAAMGLDDADFLPFGATFARFVPRYVEWLHARDAAGARWQRGEFDAAIRPAQLQGAELYGRIDRIDSLPSGAMQLIDYKTGSVRALLDKVQQPLEDTQLAFYAALMAPQMGDDLEALYLALDETKGIKEVPHRGVADTAERFVAGLSSDYARLRQGAGLPALGEGSVCDFCAARGLCRRDHWEAP